MSATCASIRQRARRVVGIAVVVACLLLCAAPATGQSRIAPGQIPDRPIQVSPPEAATFFPEAGQVVYLLTPPGTNRTVVKVEVFLNGLLLTDVSAPGFDADYSLSADKRTLTLSAYYQPWIGTRTDGRDVLRVLYWVR